MLDLGGLGGGGGGGTSSSASSDDNRVVGYSRGSDNGTSPWMFVTIVLAVLVVVLIARR